MKNKYSIAFFNNQQHQTYSLNLSKISIFLIFFSILSFIGFSINITYLYYNNNLDDKIKKLHVLEPKINTFINHLIDNQIINGDLLQKFNLLNENKAYNNFTPIAMPVEGFVSKGLDIKNLHKGIDIACSFNAKVKATQDGMIVFSDNIAILGNTVIIAHPNQYFSLYAHLNKNIVAAQTYVNKNQIIGFAGQSGNSEGPHLHFEIWQNDDIIDPRNLITEYRINDVSIR